MSIVFSQLQEYNLADLIESMIHSAKKALNHAYAPYSNYPVAACLVTEDGSLFTGVNVENASYGLTICAESAAICQMITAGQRKINAIVILNSAQTLCPPCGACRQRIAEFSTSETMVHLCNHEQIIKSIPFDSLLPEAFRLKP